MNHVHAWCPQRSKEGMKSPAIGVINGCEPLWVLGTESRFSNSKKYFSLLNPGHLDPLLFFSLSSCWYYRHMLTIPETRAFFFELGFCRVVMTDCPGPNVG